MSPTITPPSTLVRTHTSDAAFAQGAAIHVANADAGAHAGTAASVAAHAAKQAPTSFLTLAAHSPQGTPPLALISAAIQALVQWQTKVAPNAQPVVEATLYAGLHGFTTQYLAGLRHWQPDAGMTKILDTAFDTLVAHCMAWPAVRIQGNFGATQLHLQNTSPLEFEVAGPTLELQGPVTFDIAGWVRDPALSWDEPFGLDVAIRYWDCARKAGLPVGADFGFFYKGLEWAALLQHLTQLGVAAAAAPASRSAAPLASRLIAMACAVCARYIELKPLLRLIERVEGLQAPEGFAIGRM